MLSREESLRGHELHLGAVPKVPYLFHLVFPTCLLLHFLHLPLPHSPHQAPGDRKMGVIDDGVGIDDGGMDTGEAWEGHNKEGMNRQRMRDKDTHA